jgi:chromosome segregation ATPase
VNLPKYRAILEEHQQVQSSARDIGVRMREAKDKRDFAQADLDKAEAVLREQGNPASGNARAAAKAVDELRTKAERARDEFARLQHEYTAAGAAIAASGQLVDNLRRFLTEQGIQP